MIRRLDSSAGTLSLFGSLLALRQFRPEPDIASVERSGGINDKKLARANVTYIVLPSMFVYCYRTRTNLLNPQHAFLFSCLPTMPARVRPSRPQKKVTSSTTREYLGRNFGGKHSKKVLKLSQVGEQKRQLDEKRKNDEHRKFSYTSREYQYFRVFVLGAIMIFRQKIAESGIMANKSPSDIDWTIIPDISYVRDDQMDTEPHSDNWEDVIEEGAVAEQGHGFEQMAALIMYASCFVADPISDLTVGHFLAVQNIQPGHGINATMLQSKSGKLSYHPSLTRISNGSVAVHTAPRWNLTTPGRFLCLGLTVYVL